ncbi:hypothetical protein GTY70_02820 [Stenotrophomonas maltophilia]|nr:hypothetical protein [Stenotrophomonas maltophilia]MCF3507330.1 hypothetical protein [Stenotrophomonas maltophilia]
MIDIEQRITAAIERITSGNAPMRVPADETDPDLVLADCLAEIRRLRAALAARQPVGYSGVRTCGDERPCINCYSDQGDCLGPAPSQDSTHQPVLQEPVAWISRIRCVGAEYGKEIYGKLPVQSLNPLYYEHIPLYAAPPAQAVDLANFKALYRAYVRLLESGRDRIRDLGGTCDPVDVMEANDVDLQAARRVMDCQAVGNG